MSNQTPFLKSSKTNWKYILIVLILAILVSGGILGYVKDFKREMISLSQFLEIKRPEKVIEEEKVVEETADWKIYRNEEYGFEIKYPPNYRISLETATDVGPAIKANSYAQIIFRDFTGYFTREEIENKKNNSEKIKVSSLEVFRSSIGGNMDGGIEFSVEFYDYPKEGMVFNILFSTHQPGKEDEINTFNQMLSTFRFLE